MCLYTVTHVHIFLSRFSERGHLPPLFWPSQIDRGCLVNCYIISAETNAWHIAGAHWIAREWRRGRAPWEGISSPLTHGAGGRGVPGGVDSTDEFCAPSFLPLGASAPSSLPLSFGITIVIYTSVSSYSHLSSLGSDSPSIPWLGTVYGFNKSWWNEWLSFSMSFWDTLELGPIKYSNLKPKRWKKRDSVYIMSRGEPPGNFTVYFNPMCVGEPRHSWKKSHSCLAGVNVLPVPDRPPRR